MNSLTRGMVLLGFLLVLSGCAANSIEEVLEDGILHIEILNETETEFGTVVFYKTEAPGETYGARLLQKNGMNWEAGLGGVIPAIKEVKKVAWGWQSSEDEPTFFYGIVIDDEISRLTINGTEAEIKEAKNGIRVFYLLTHTDGLVIQENGEEGTQIKGFSEEGNLIYQRLNFD